MVFSLLSDKVIKLQGFIEEADIFGFLGLTGVLVNHSVIPLLIWKGASMKESHGFKTMNEEDRLKTAGLGSMLAGGLLCLTGIGVAVGATMVAGGILMHHEGNKKAEKTKKKN